MSAGSAAFDRMESFISWLDGAEKLCKVAITKNGVLLKKQ
jgi:hypothetical protein